MTMRHTSGGRSIRSPLHRVRGIVAVLAATAVALLSTAPPAAADEIRDRQWHLGFLDIAEAHQVTRGKGVTVAVIDTGVQADHPDLRGNVLAGHNVDTGGDGRKDEDGHGTSMASLIAAHGHGSDDGVLGIAPDAKILPVSIGATSANPSQIAEAVRWATDHGAQIINMSIEATGEDAELQQAIADAQANDIVVVGSAGNTGSDYTVGPPAAYPGVIAVSATARSGRFASDVSVQGDPVDLAAPGKNIVHAANKSGYFVGTGTSDSAAIVSGVAALVRARYPDLDAANVINRLVKTADDKGPRGRDPQYGLGIVNPVQSLTANVRKVTENPLGTLAEEPAQPSPPPTDNPATPTNQAAPGDDGGGGTNALLIAIIIAVVAAAAAAAIAILVVTRNRRRPATASLGQPSPPGQPRPPDAGPYPPPGPHHQPPPHWPPPGQR